MRDIIGHGGGKGGGSSHTHYEAPDSLHSTSYARVLDLVSEGEILGLAEGLQSVYLNDTPVQNADGTSNFQGITVDFRTGTQAQDYIPGFPDVESETTVGVELKYGTPWVRAISNTALSAVRITLGVDQLYKADTNNGDVGGTIVSYVVELSTDGGAYQTVLSNSFNGKTMSAYQRSARIDLPRATTGWQIRVSRLTPNSTVVSIVDKTTIVSFTEVIDAKLRYPMSAIVGVQVDAKQFQSVPTRAYDLFGRIIQVPSNYDAKTRTYSGTWDGTFKPSWSDNPAWVFRDLALNDRYGLGNRITAAQLDKWALYKIARYCDEMVSDGKGGTEPRFTCNLYLQTRKQAYAVLQDIASIFRGISYWGAGTIMASADMPADPVYVYTAANVIGGKFTRTGTKKATRYTVAMVTWNDPADNYKPKVEYVEDREGIARYGIQQTELTAFGCTSQGQAHRAGRWALATSRLETEGITFDVGMDGAIALPGQIVRIADPSRMGRRVGGRVRAVAGRTITLDKAPTVNVGDRLTVMMPGGTSETRAVAAVAGDAVTVDSDWTTAPRAQAVWSVDSNELSAPLFRVLSVTEKDSITFTITAVQHEPGKYDFVENGTAITPRNQTALDVTRQAPPASVTLAGYTVSLADVQKLALQVSCAPVAGAVAYEGAYRRGNDNWIAIPRQPSPTMDVLDILPGTYMAKMSAVNSIGVTSIETQSVAVEIARDGASKNATIILQSDAQQFHIDENGQTDPLTITFSAILIALDGPVTWSCLGGSLTNTTATTAQLAFANASGPAAVVTASITAFGRTYTQSLTIRKVQDGAAGSDGLQTDVARLYLWAPTTPNKPVGTSTFSWAALTNGGYTGNDGWASPAPNNPGNPLWRLYVASVGVSAPIAATSSPVSYTNATIEAWSQNGANGSKGDTGASGIQSRPATIYRWDISIPAGPTGPATFKWSDGTFGAAPANWTLTPGTAPSLGMTLFAATYQVVDSATAATTAFNWQSAAVMAIGYVGTNGSKGDTGAQGASYVTAYIASSAIAANGAPAQTTGRGSLPAANSSGLAGAWSASVPTLADGQRMYQSDGIYDPTTDKVTWSIPYWSSLKVGTLSAITANLGAINAGSINLGNGTFTVDNDGNLVCRSIKIVDPVTGETVLQAGGQLNPKYAAPGTLNSDIAVGGRNLAEDSAFEGRLRPWTAAAGGAYNVHIETGPDGRKNLVFESNGGDSYVDGQGSWIPVVPGKQYMLSFEYANAGTITASSSYIYMSNGDGQGLFLDPLNTGGTRVRRSQPWTCPAGVTGITFRFGFWCTSYAWMRVYNFDVQEGNKAAPWSPAPEDLRADAQARADAAANAATSAATTYAAAQADLARINAQAYADGKVTAEEQRAINDAAAKAEAARVAAVSAAAADATAKAAVAATMADSSGLKVGTGRPNLLEQNTLPTSTATFSTDFKGLNGEGPFIARGADTFAVYAKDRRGCIWVHAFNSPAAGTTVDIYRNDRVKIAPGQRYEFGVTLSTHRTLARAALAWYNAAGNYIGEIGGNDVTNSFWNVGSEGLPPRSVGVVTPPADARSAMLFVRQVHYGDADPYTFASQWYVAEALPGQTEPSPYAASVLEARDMAESAQAGLADKLSSTASNVLRSPIAITTGGGVVVGNMTYDAASGQRGSGQGVAITPFGIIAHNGEKYTVAIDARDGNAYFGGELQAAHGTLGSLTIDGGNIRSSNMGGFGYWRPAGGGNIMYLGTEGLQLGNYNDGKFIHAYANGNLFMPGFSMNFGQLTLDGTIIYRAKINQPDLGAKTVTGLYDVRGSNNNPNNTTVTIATYNPGMSGGDGPYTFTYSLQKDNGLLYISASSGGTCTVTARGSNNRAQGQLTVIATDKNGFSASGSCYFDIGFGSGVPA